MEIIEGFFTDVNIYNDIVNNWDLNFKLLGKSDFSAQLKMISNETFSLARQKLTGKTEQKGSTQKDFIVFGFAVNDTSFYWFDKKADSSNIIIFPEGNNFEVVSNEDYDVFVISIHKNYFFNILKDIGVFTQIPLYDGKSKMLFLSKSFSNRFSKLLHHFMNSNLKNDKKNKTMIKTIVTTLIEYLNETNLSYKKTKTNKKDVALKKAVNIISDHIEDLYSIKQICAMVGVSERALLYAFKEKYKVSTSEYIKAHRLNKVKQEIYNTKTKSISKIAGKYNFWHMGQFAKDFKKQFGILPSEVRKNIKFKN